MEKESWRDIEGYEGAYQISNYGNIKSLSRTIKRECGDFVSKERIMKPSTDFNGRKWVRLRNGKQKRSHKIHRLVAIAFIGKSPEDKPVVNHKDGNQSNNHVSNLEWRSQSENVQHAYNTGLIKVFIISKQQLFDLYCVKGLSAGEIAKINKTTRSVIYNNLKKHGIERRSASEHQNAYHLTPGYLMAEIVGKKKKMTDLAKEIGCDPSLISRTIKKFKSKGVWTP